MNYSSFANVYFSNVLDHVDSMKKEEMLIAERRTWTKHTTQASDATAICCCCLDCTWVYFDCLTCKCCCKKKFDGKMSVSHKMAVFETDNLERNRFCGCFKGNANERSVVDIIDAPTMTMQDESKDYCCQFCVIKRNEYEINIPTSRGIYQVGLISDLSTALAGFWPAWKVLGTAPFLAGVAEKELTK